MTVATDNTLKDWAPEILGSHRREKRREKAKLPPPTEEEIKKEIKKKEQARKDAERRRLLCLSVATPEELGKIQRWGDQLGKSKRKRRLYDELHQRAFQLMTNAEDSELEMLDVWIDNSQLSNIRELMAELRSRA